MIRVVFAFFVVINVIVALWVNISSKGVNGPEVSSEAPLLQGDDLILISEVDASQLIGREETIIDEVSASPDFSDSLIEAEQALIVNQCMVLAPFQFRDDAEDLADQIMAFGVDVEILEEKIEAQGPIMVYIKPFMSAQEAQRELRVLKASQIDSFIISDGELTNGISLGVFRTEQNALAQEVRIEALGYDVETSHILVQKDQFSLVASGEVLAALEDDYWLKISNENKDISIEQKVCNEVASGRNFQ